MNFQEAITYINDFIKDIKVKDKTKRGASFVFDNLVERDLKLLSSYFIGKKYGVKTRYVEDIDYDVDGNETYKTHGEIYVNWK